MNEISNELGRSNTHTISGEYGIGNFTLIYYNLTTEPTTYTSTHTTTVSTTIFNTIKMSATIVSTTIVNPTLLNTASVSVTMFDTTTVSSIMRSPTTVSVTIISATMVNPIVLNTTRVSVTKVSTFSLTAEGKVQCTNILTCKNLSLLFYIKLECCKIKFVLTFTNIMHEVQFQTPFYFLQPLL